MHGQTRTAPHLHGMRAVHSIDCAFTCCAALVLLVGVMLCIGLLALQTPAAQRALNCRLIVGVSCDSAHAGRITYGRITGFYPLSFTVHDISVRTPDGQPLAFATDARLSLRPSAYLVGRGLVADELSADTVLVSEAWLMPPPPPSPGPGAGGLAGAARTATGAAATQPTPVWLDLDDAVTVHMLRLGRARVVHADAVHARDLAAPSAHPELALFGNLTALRDWAVRLRVYPADETTVSGDYVQLVSSGHAASAAVESSLDWTATLGAHRVRGRAFAYTPWRTATLLTVPYELLDADPAHVTLDMAVTALADPRTELVTGRFSASIDAHRRVRLASARAALDAGALELSGDLGQLDAPRHWPHALALAASAYGVNASAACTSAGSPLECAGTLNGIGGTLRFVPADAARTDDVPALELVVGEARARVSAAGMPSTAGPLLDWLRERAAATALWSVHVSAPSWGALDATLVPDERALRSLAGTLTPPGAASAGAGAGAGALCPGCAWRSLQLSGQGSEVRASVRALTWRALALDAAELSFDVAELGLDESWGLRKLCGTGQLKGRTGAAHARFAYTVCAEAQARGARTLAVRTDNVYVDAGVREIVATGDRAPALVCGFASADTSSDIARACSASGALDVLAGADGDVQPWIEAAYTPTVGYRAFMFENAAAVLALAHAYAAASPDSVVARLLAELPGLELEGDIVLNASAPALGPPALANVRLRDASVHMPGVAWAAIDALDADAEWPSGAYSVLARHASDGQISARGTAAVSPSGATVDVDSSWAHRDGCVDTITARLARDWPASQLAS